jgi:hypothetical protein
MDMRLTPRSVIGVIGAVLPIAYCARLVYYLVDTGGWSLEEVKALGLGPTVIGLSVIGVFFCILFVFKIFRLLRTPRSPGSNGPSASNPSPADDEPGFDADEVISRYIGQRASEAGQAAASRTIAPPSQPPRPTFGRRAG